MARFLEDMFDIVILGISHFLESRSYVCNIAVRYVGLIEGFWREV